MSFLCSDCSCGLCNINRKCMKLVNCGHIICLKCLCKNVCEVQWFDNFECDETLFCPCCFNEIARVNWTLIIDFLVYLKFLQPEIVFDNQNRYHLIYNRYKPEPPNVDREYSIKLTEFPVYI